MTLMQGNLAWVRQFLRAESGISLAPDQDYLLLSRLEPLARQAGFNGAPALIAAMPGQGSRMRQEVLEALLNHETWFFREPRLFAALRQHVLPDLAARGQELAIWSAACASGQETYSLAMLLREHFPQAVRNLRLLGSDISPLMAAQAAQGCYTQAEVNRGLPAHLLVRWFTQQGDTWQIRPEIQNTARFFPLNLARPWPAMPPLDLVLLCNALIYMERETRRQIMARVARTLKPGGWLFLSSAETVPAPDGDFEPQALAGGVYGYRLRARLEQET